MSDTESSRGKEGIEQGADELTPKVSPLDAEGKEDVPALQTSPTPIQLTGRALLNVVPLGSVLLGSLAVYLIPWPLLGFPVAGLIAAGGYATLLAGFLKVLSFSVGILDQQGPMSDTESSRGKEGIEQGADELTPKVSPLDAEGKEDVRQQVREQLHQERQQAPR